MHVLPFLLIALSLAACSDDPSPKPSDPTNEPDDDESDDATVPTGRLDAGGIDARRPDPTPVDASSDSATPVDARVVDAAPARVAPTITPPIVTGPVAGKPFSASDRDLASFGYIEQEFFIEGTANTYVSKGPRGLDGKWAAERGTQAKYTTRLLVRRPVKPADFNGTAFVEWLNVTGGFDTEIAFPFAWEELLRGGYAYVGVSVQKAGVDSLKSADAQRYAALVHPGDQFAYDLYAQAGFAVGWPSGVSPLGELKAERVLAYGESQSAMRMITFVNAIHPLTRVYDGYIVHSRAGWGAAIGDESDALLGDGTPVQVRADLGARVLQLFTESELFLALGPAYAARQPDSDSVRTWEMAGTAHADTRLLGAGTDLACGGATVNDGPQHFIVKAGVRAMHRWLAEGVAPAKGTPIDVTGDKMAIARDANGNATGGVRTPSVDVPIATHSGVSNNPACLLFGWSAPFSAEKLRTLYPTHQDYVSKVEAAARDARDKGFVLPEEETSILATANAAAIPN